MAQPKSEPSEPKPRKRIRRRAGVRSRMPAGLERFRSHVKEADKLWSLIVRSRTTGWCQRCSIGRGHDAHHLVSRLYKQTRWLLDNGAHLCRGCHMLVGRDGEENRLLAIRLIGEERWEQLQITKHCRAKVDPLAARVVLQTIATGLKLL